jgi:uncharacterized protein
VTDSLIQIPIDGDNEAFFDAAANGELRIQACASCDRLRFPPRPICPWCHSTEFTWREVSGGGRIWSFVVPHPPLQPPFADRAPYNVVVVELEDDPLIRLVGNVVADDGDGLSFVDPSELEIGATVRVTFPIVPDEPRLPRWILVS